MTIMQVILAGGIGAGAGEPEFIGASSNGNNGSSFTLAYPAGIESGDLMLIVASSKQSGRDHPTAPAGWAETSGETGIAAYTRTATGTESGTLTMGAGDEHSGAVLFVIRNVSSVLVDADWNWYDEDGLPITPASVATAAGQLHLVGASGREVENISPPAGYTLATQVTSQNNSGAGACYGITSAAGSTGTKQLGAWDVGENIAAWSVIIGAP